MTDQLAIFPNAPTDNPAADLRPSTRYLCLTCEPMPDVQTGDPDADGECRCPSCREILHSFAVLACPTCGEWACTDDESDVARFRAEHRCSEAG